jgi:hypothetical protein
MESSQMLGRPQTFFTNPVAADERHSEKYLKVKS